MDESGPIVLPSVPDFLGTIQSKKERLTRLDLANWLTDSQNGKENFMPAFWPTNLVTFSGKGLAPDLTDFGGENPT